METEILTIEEVAETMMGNGIIFKDIYYPELSDCVDDLIGTLGKLGPNGLTKAMIKLNGWKNIKECLRVAPSLENDFGKVVLYAWIKLFLEYPDLMELVGIIAEQENPKADPKVVKKMREFKISSLVLKSNKRGPLTGMRVVFSGASKYFKGEDMEKWLQKNGATTTHTVTTNTELLIIGNRPASSKLVKAKRYGIKIITEEEFVKELKDQLIGLP